VLVTTVAGLSANAADCPTPATDTFLSNRTVVRGFVVGERVVAFTGASLDTNVTAAAPDTFVESFVQTNKSAFGVDNPKLKYEQKITLGNGSTVYTYKQRIGGTCDGGTNNDQPCATDANWPGGACGHRVYGGVMRVVFVGGPSEKVTAANFRLTPPPATGLPAPTGTE